MKSNEELLSFLDLLDFDEEIIDLRIKSIVQKTNFSNEILSNLLNLLQYKHLINTKEDSECENEQEFKIVNNLLSNMMDKNVDLTAKIVYIILILNPSSIVYKAEHLFQQLIANMYIPNTVSTVCNTSDTEHDKLNSTFLQLKICQNVLDAVISCGQKLSLPFLESPLEHLVCSEHEHLNTFFLTSMIPKMFEGISGYHILDRIWNLLKQLDRSEVSLKVICSLSNYYLPMPNESNYESEVITYSEFWDILFDGLSSNSSKNRKFSMYLIKRAIDCLMPIKKDMHIKSKCIFTWECDKKEKIKGLWKDFFALMDSLEEKQSNIVLPSLILINTIKDIGYCWVNCAFNIGLSHDNNQVRFKCINYRLDYPIHNLNEAVMLLEAINDTNLFGEASQQKSFENKMKISLDNYDNRINILKTMPYIKWAPVPLFYMTKILKDLNITVTHENNKDNMSNILQNLLKLQCTNIVIRKAIYVNLSSFIKKCCRLQWKDYINICGCLPTEINLNINERDHAHSSFIKYDLMVPKEENEHLLKLINLYVNIDFALIYFSGHDRSDFKDILNRKLNNIMNISERQYSKKSEFISDTIFITEFYRRIQSSALEDKYINVPYNLCSVILNYVKSLLSSDENFDIDDLAILFEGLNLMVTNCTNSNKEILLQLLLSSLLVLKDVTVDLNKRVLNILTLNCTLKCPVIVKKHLPESEIVTTLLNGLQFSNKESNESIGRLKNTFYEKSSEIFYLLVQNNNSLPINNDILNFINHIIDSGGYGCLNWILQIMNKIIPNIIQGNHNYDISKFLSKAWREIEELKTNNQYSICIKEFVTILLHDDLLKNTMYNNIILMYCSKIIEYGAVKTLPLYYLVNEMNLKNITASSHIIYIFSDILLYSVVPKKENRISEDVIEKILKDTYYNICKTKDFHFISHIRYLSIHTLSKITETDILNTIADFIIRRVDEIFKNKQRYHGNSQVHRTVQAAIQNLLFMTLRTRSINIEKIGLWCMELLGKLPHQQFVRTCLEWYIALFFYIERRELNNDILKQLQSKNIPITSQFLILYFVLMRKIKSDVCSIEEYQFVMDTYLSHTMGPTYSVRLHAQYLAHRIKDSGSKFNLKKYNLILEVIEQTLTNASADKDKSYQKLLKDYFVHKFDIVEDLTPWHIYHYLPMSDNFKENIDVEFFDDRMNEIYKNIDDEGKDTFYEEWRLCRKTREYLENFEPCDYANKNTENNEVGTIQKKYVPWKSMSDVGIYGTEEKGNKSDLIVVASLIDRLPNLGGMARTSEVFGVLTYVVDSLRHLQDKQFQGLSVSAERWINVEEVRPGKPLKDYLMMKKSEGYSIVAAEQTSSSTPLQTFRFPKKTLLLLGHEKEGVPCDFLPLMDACVEIPQQGVIRSLNVHVTAAIFVWEYARQIML